MSRRSVSSSPILILVLILLADWGGGSGADLAASPANVNLIFVVSHDLAYQGAGDVNSTTANLTNQGLQRSLDLATYLKEQMGQR